MQAAGQSHCMWCMAEHSMHPCQVWGSDGAGSGVGSTLHATTWAAAALLEVLQMKGVKSMVDAPCGAMEWMPAALRAYGRLRPEFRQGMDSVLHSLSSSLGYLGARSRPQHSVAGQVLGRGHRQACHSGSRREVRKRVTVELCGARLHCRAAAQGRPHLLQGRPAALAAYTGKGKQATLCVVMHETLSSYTAGTYDDCCMHWHRWYWRSRTSQSRAPSG